MFFYKMHFRSRKGIPLLRFSTLCFPADDSLVYPVGIIRFLEPVAYAPFADADVFRHVFDGDLVIDRTGSVS